MSTKISRELLIMHIYDHHTKRDLAEHMFDNCTDAQKLEWEVQYNSLYMEDEGPTPWEHASTD